MGWFKRNADRQASKKATVTINFRHKCDDIGVLWSYEFYERFSHGDMFTLDLTGCEVGLDDRGSYIRIGLPEVSSWRD